jgi:hypothetical protein
VVRCAIGILNVCIYSFIHVSLRWTKGGEVMNILLRYMNAPGREMDVYINSGAPQIPPLSPPSPREQASEIFS